MAVLKSVCSSLKYLFLTKAWYSIPIDLPHDAGLLGVSLNLAVLNGNSDQR